MNPNIEVEREAALDQKYPPSHVPGIVFSDRVAELFVTINGAASDAVMDSLRLASAHAFKELQEQQPELSPLGAGVAATDNLYRKKPVVIHAVQFTQEVRDAHVLDKAPLPDGVICVGSNYHLGRREVHRADCIIETLEGRMKVELGDWIITGVKGEHYPCKPDIFAATYEPANSKEPAEHVGWKLAMRVLQSPLYAQLDDSERAECDALVKCNPHFPTLPEAAAQPVAVDWADVRETIWSAINYAMNDGAGSTDTLADAVVATLRSMRTVDAALATHPQPAAEIKRSAK